MVLEDLVASGCRFPHPKDDDIAWRARDIVEQMAALHAHSGSRPASTTAATSRGSRRRAPAAAGGATFVKMAVDNLGDRLPEEFHRLADIYLAQRRHRAAVELRTAHARARRPAPRQPLRRHRRRRPDRLPRLGDDRPLARTARRRVRDVQLDPGRGPRRRRAGLGRPLLLAARRVGHRPRRRDRVGAVPAVRRLLVGLGDVDRGHGLEVATAAHRPGRHEAGDRGVRPTRLRRAARTAPG